MTHNAVVRARLNEQVKEEAAIVLAAMGLTLSDAFRIMLTRIGNEKALPFEPLIPNQDTLSTMRAARKRHVTKVESVDKLMDSLD